jgi:hypothetical protein
MIFKVIKEPEMFNWSGNPLLYAVACLPYTATQLALDVRIQFTLQVERERGLGNFIDIKTETLTPGADGITQIDASSLADAYLKYEFPSPSILASERCDKQSRNFRMKFSYFVNGEHVFFDEYSGACVVLKGGLPYDGLKTTDSWVEVLAGKILRLNTYHTLDPMQPAFASFMYMGDAAVAEPTFTCTIRTQTGDLVTTHQLAFTLRKGDLFYIPLGKLSAQANTDRFSIVIISFLDDGGEPIQDFTFNYETRRYFKVADLLFINSLGGIDSLRLYGELGSTGDYDQTIVNLGYSQSDNKETLPADQVEINSSLQQKYTGNTGFVKLTDEGILKSIMLNRLAFQLGDNNYLMPVIVTKKQLAGPVSTAFLYDVALEWSEATRHSFFSQLSQGHYQVVACPALLSFNAEQETSTSIRITWSCPQPYQKIKVLLSDGTPANDIVAYLEGSYGSELIVMDLTGDITAEGRLICGVLGNIDGTVTPSLGPASIKNIALVPNRAPVANADYFNLNTGYSTPQQLPGNVLTNDNDPDGDPIEVIAASGVTMQGGFYSITAAGVVYYTPPYAAFAGTDQFDYTIREVANPTSTGNSFVVIAMVAGGSTEIVYAKIWYSNPPNGNGGNMNSDVYIKHFANAICTVPKDVSLMNITFLYTKRERTVNMGNGDVTINNYDISVMGTGVQTFIYSGPVRRITYHGLFLTQHIHFTEFFLRPAAGYIIA